MLRALASILMTGTAVVSAPAQAAAAAPADAAPVQTPETDFNQSR